MGKLKKFLKKNSGFVLLLLLLLCITSSLGVYTVLKNRDVSTPEITLPQEKEPVSENAEIRDFTGTYNRASGQILFRWEITQNNAEISNIHLYHNDNDLLNVTSYSSYDLPREGYAIPTGDNSFTLKLTQEDGKVIEKKITVFVDYVVTMEQVVTQAVNKTKITLVYQYEKRHPVNEPQMILLDDSIGFAYLRYVGTTMNEKDGLITAKTTYEFTWNETPVNFETFSVRWSFKDINDSKDFTLEKGVPSQAENNN